MSELPTMCGECQDYDIPDDVHAAQGWMGRCHKFEIGRNDISKACRHGTRIPRLPE